MPDVAEDMTVFAGLFLVTSVAPEVRLLVLQVTNESQVEALPATVQGVAERVPEGHATVLQVFEELPPSSELQSAPPFEGVGLVQVRVCVPVLPQAVTLQALQGLQPPLTGQELFGGVGALQDPLH